MLLSFGSEHDFGREPTPKSFRLYQNSLYGFGLPTWALLWMLVKSPLTCSIAFAVLSQCQILWGTPRTSWTMRCTLMQVPTKVPAWLWGWLLQLIQDPESFREFQKKFSLWEWVCASSVGSDITSWRLCTYLDTKNECSHLLTVCGLCLVLCPGSSGILEWSLYWKRRPSKEKGKF